jgi:hypothetical protein
MGLPLLPGRLAQSGLQVHRLVFPSALDSARDHFKGGGEFLGDVFGHALGHALVRGSDKCEYWLE